MLDFVFAIILRHPGESMTTLFNNLLWPLVDISAVVGLVTGVSIIAGGILMQSADHLRRRMGYRLTLLMAIVGFVNTIGGLVFGFILALVGFFLGRTDFMESQMANITPVSSPLPS